MSTTYRFKFYAVRGTRTPGPYIVLDDIWMRIVPGGSYINTTANGSATAFSFYSSSSTPAHALPDMGSSVWHSAAVSPATMASGEAWWQYEFYANGMFVCEYKFKVRGDTYWQYDSPITWTLEWYNNRKDLWVVIDSRSNVSWSAAGQERVFTINYQYLPPGRRNNLTGNSNYIFRASESGIHVYNTEFSGIGFIPIEGGVPTDIRFNCIYANEDYLYIGTNFSGVAYMSMGAIASGMYQNYSPYKKPPYILSNNVLDIHGQDDYLCIVTDSGVDEINTNTDSRYYATISGVSRCFQTASGIYYLIGGTLNAVYDLNSNWTTPNYIYSSASHPSFFNVTSVNDLHVKDGVIYLATDNGVIIIKEMRGNEVNSDYKRFKEI